MAELKVRLEKTAELLDKAIARYFKGEACACQYPRFVQIAGINCRDYKALFKAWETTILIQKIKEHFEIEMLIKGPELANEKWTCKKCQSEFRYGWSDFSIEIEREVLTPLKIVTKEIGEKAKNPIPLYGGLYGHTYPKKNEFVPVDFETFEKYIMEE